MKPGDLVVLTTSQYTLLEEGDSVDLLEDPRAERAGAVRHAVGRMMWDQLGLVTAINPEHDTAMVMVGHGNSMGWVRQVYLRKVAT